MSEQEPDVTVPDVTVADATVADVTVADVTVADVTVIVPTYRPCQSDTAVHVRADRR
jgi:hypothetical protein